MKSRSSKIKKHPKTWEEKFSNPKEPKVKKLDKKFVDIPSESKMLIATPQIFENYIRSLKPGEFRTLKQIRNELAGTFQADATCPVTTGIFLRIVAETNFEKWKQGTPLNQIAPFWRVIDPSSPLASKLSFGNQFIVEQREKESLN